MLLLLLLTGTPIIQGVYTVPLAIRTGICRCLMSTSPTNNVIFGGFDQKRTLWYRYDSIAEPTRILSLFKREIERIQSNRYERDIGQQNEEKNENSWMYNLLGTFTDISRHIATGISDPLPQTPSFHFYFFQFTDSS